MSKREHQKRALDRLPKESKIVFTKMPRLSAETSHQRARVDVNNSRVLAHGRTVHGDVGGCVGERRTRLVVESRHSRLVHGARAEQLAVLHELRVE